MAAKTNADIEDVQGLSGLQQSMLYTSLSEPSGGHYIEQFYLDFSYFSPECMQQALDELMKRRWALRSLFVWREQDSARLVTLSQLKSVLCRVDYVEADMLLAADRARGFLLDQESPIRFSYAPGSDDSARCILTFHHAAVDGWSIANLTHELLSLYGALLQNQPLPPTQPDPKPPPVAADSDNSRWESYLAGSTSTVNLGKLVQPLSQPPAYAELETQLSPEQTQRIGVWCRKERVTLSTLVHGAWGLTLSYLNGTSSVTYGSIDSGRAKIANGESAVGMLMSLMPIKVQVQADSAINGFVSQFQSDYWNALQYPPPDPAWLAGRQNKPASVSLFDSVLIIQNYPQPQGWDNIHLKSLSGHEQADVPLVLAVGAGEALTALFRYQSHSLEASAVASVSLLFSRILVQICAEGSETVAQLFAELSNQIGASGPREKTFSGNTDEAWQRCVDEFLARVDEKPDAVAYVTSDADEVTYLELSCRAEAVREALTKSGVTSGDIVGLQLARSVDAVAAMLAVLAQDAIYLPLDPNYPEHRLQQMTQDAQPVLVVDDRFLQSALQRKGESSDTKLGAATQPQCKHMCLLYTSGSTGKPKGVMLSHAAVSNRLSWQADQFPVLTSDVFCVRTPLSFVDSVSEIFFPLVRGASSLLIDDATLHSLKKFREALALHAVSRVLLVPSLLAALLEELHQSGEALASLRQCVVSGEALTTKLAQRFNSLLPQATLLNFYGSTEVTADALWYAPDVHKVGVDTAKALVPIGRPIRNMSARLVNSWGQNLPPMVIGELVISGAGVATGYYRAEDDAQAKFSNGAFYTGDLAHRDERDILHFHGRADRQVQISGRRVEPAEVERALCELEDIRSAAVWLHNGRLVALYCSASEGGDELSRENIVRHLRDTLPAHFVPTRLRCTAQLPLLASGKLDQQALDILIEKVDITNTTPDFRGTPSGQVEKIASELVGNLWREMLPVTTLDPDANFFDAGGSSLLAMQMLARLERSLNREIPLAILIDHPTVSGLAKALCDDGAQNSSANVTTLREGNAGAQGSILCIHGDAYNLAALVADDRPIFWLSQWQLRMELVKQARVLPHETVEEMAARYVGYLDRVDLGERTTVLAACAAGIVAIEVARMLGQRGMDVHLVLMDLPGCKLKGRAKERNQESFPGVASKKTKPAIPEQVQTRTSRFIRLPGLLGRATRFVRFRLRKTLTFQRYQVAKYDKVAATGAALTEEQALAYCNGRLNISLSSYELSAIEIPVELVWSRQWGGNQAGASAVMLPKRWDGVFRQLASVHFSPASHHNDLLQNESARFVADILGVELKG